jgi:hypothetical protein
LIDLIKPLFCGTAEAEPLRNFVAGPVTAPLDGT